MQIAVMLKPCLFVASAGTDQGDHEQTLATAAFTPGSDAVGERTRSTTATGLRGGAHAQRVVRPKVTKKDSSVKASNARPNARPCSFALPLGSTVQFIENHYLRDLNSSVSRSTLPEQKASFSKRFSNLIMRAERQAGGQSDHITPMTADAGKVMPIRFSRHAEGLR